jgi:uncharacterized Fe-S center protein
MTEKAIVYWASPNEIASLKNTAKNMVTNNLVKTRLVLDKILDNINSGDKVAVKVHVGEALNTHYLRHDYVREVVNAINAKGGIPTLIETHGQGNTYETLEICEDYSICVGHRRSTIDHDKIAHLHGYTESIIGAPLRFIDGENGTNGKLITIDGIQFKDNPISVAEGLFDYDKMVVISHFKGHPQAGFGGALKQIGIGCVTKRNKFLAHMEEGYIVNTKKCDITQCNKECIDACPVKAIKMEGEKASIDGSKCFGCYLCVKKCPIKRAIKAPKMNEVKDFVERFIENVVAVLTFGPENIRYINFAFDITMICDCTPNPGMPVVPDLGIFGSSDPVAIDKACVDMETEAPGLPVLNKEEEWSQPIASGIEKFKAMMSIVDPPLQFEASLKNKIGSIDYELIKL